MLVYSINRIAQLIPIVLILSFIVFMFVEALPGDIIDAMADIESDIDETRAALAKTASISPGTRYLYWLGDIARGDFGNSGNGAGSNRTAGTYSRNHLSGGRGYRFITHHRDPVRTLAAVNRNSPVDYSAQVTSLAGISIPEFWFAILSILVFSLYFPIFPSSGYVGPGEDFGLSLWYPWAAAVAIGFRQAAYTTRLTRSSMLDEVNKDYVVTHRSLGLPERR